MTSAQSPLAIHGNPIPDGAFSFVLSTLAIGLSYGWVAWRTGSIRWTVVSHICLNFLGLGAILYLGG
jgi:membrane protease YdiL (CAAX protease family)